MKGDWILHTHLLRCSLQDHATSTVRLLKVCLIRDTQKHKVIYSVDYLIRAWYRCRIGYHAYKPIPGAVCRPSRDLIFTHLSLQLILVCFDVRCIPDKAWYLSGLSTVSIVSYACVLSFEASLMTMNLISRNSSKSSPYSLKVLRSRNAKTDSHDTVPAWGTSLVANVPNTCSRLEENKSG